MSRAMLPIYYGTSFLTLCQISGLKKAFENIIKYQTALKFAQHASISDWPEDFHHPTNAYFSCNRDLCRAMLPIYYGTSVLTLCQISGLKKAFEKIINPYIVPEPSPGRLFHMLLTHQLSDSLRSVFNDPKPLLRCSSAKL